MPTRQEQASHRTHHTGPACLSSSVIIPCRYLSDYYHASLHVKWLFKVKRILALNWGWHKPVYCSWDFTALTSCYGSFRNLLIGVCPDFRTVLASAATQSRSWLCQGLCTAQIPAPLIAETVWITTWLKLDYIGCWKIISMMGWIKHWIYVWNNLHLHRESCMKSSLIFWNTE